MIDDLTKADADPRAVRKVIDQCVQALEAGDNIMLYPAGHLLRENLENLGGNSAVNTILTKIPDLQVVLIKTRGIWGSSFSWATGERPSVTKALKKGILGLITSGLFFAPRRKVTLEFVEPENLPRTGDRQLVNQYLEKFFNEDPPLNVYVPYSILEKGSTRVLPQPSRGGIEGNPDAVPDSIKTQVKSFVQELTGIDKFDNDTKLGTDLGLDSLAGLEVVTWLNKEFGFSTDVESLVTVGDIMLAACGKTNTGAEVKINPPSKTWYKQTPVPQTIGDVLKTTIPGAFIAQGKRHPDCPICADTTSGVKTYRDLALAMLVLKDEIEKLAGENVGIMMPASVGATVLYLATQFAGKTPAMINWTLGTTNIDHCIKIAEVKKILTSRALIEKLNAQGIYFRTTEHRFIYIEDLAAGVSKGKKLWCKIRSYRPWRKLAKWEKEVSHIAAILFTSGSESLPKAVPLLHKNILANVGDVKSYVTLQADDSIAGILPPFHSFGLTTGIALPLSLGIRVCYYPNPTDGQAIAKIISKYQLSYLVGTPTFLSGILRASTNLQLESLKIVVSGAEKCTTQIYELARKRCPQTSILEGYGVTECAPLISCNFQDDPREGTIGKVADSMNYVIIDPQTHQRVEKGNRGMIIVSGPNVFKGYLESETDPFVEFQGKKYYSTGDLVIEQADGHLTFAGRLKRFVKLGGEMVSLPAIENVLLQAFSQETDEGPCLAVVATEDDEHPEIVLFTVRPIERAAVNEIIRSAGYSGIHNVRRVENISEIPLLGTGKTNHRELVKLLRTL